MKKKKQEDVARLSKQYKEGEWHLDEKLTEAYIKVRLPATLAVLERILLEVPEGKTLLNFGAGPGLDLDYEMTNVEHNPHFLKRAKKEKLPGVWQSSLPEEAHDLVLCSYSLGESMHMLEELWPLAKKGFIAIEPGTPKGYQNILKIREYGIEQGAFVAAPCPHEKPCPLKTGWCHFGVKLARTKEHKDLKEGKLGYEEEKYSYVILTKEKPERRARILHVPQKRTGHIRLTLCKEEGIEEAVISRKSPNFKSIKKKRWGESI